MYALAYISVCSLSHISTTAIMQRLQQQQARAAAERGLPPPPGPGLQAPSSASMQPSAVAGAVGNKGAASSAAAAAALPPSAFPGLPPPTPPPQDRKNLQNIRVVQRNLIYVIGISPSLASEEVRATLAAADTFVYFYYVFRKSVHQKMNLRPH